MNDSWVLWFIVDIWYDVIKIEFFSCYDYRRLNDNKLTGSIPRELTTLPNLRVLLVLKFCYYLHIYHEPEKDDQTIWRWFLFVWILFLHCCSDVSNNNLCGTIPPDGPFGSFPMEGYSFLAFFLVSWKFAYIFVNALTISWHGTGALLPI